jgi:hypothetical protein
MNGISARNRDRRSDICTTRSCLMVDQGLFCEDYDELGFEEEFKPPEGPVKFDLEELIQLTAEKRRRPRLAERKIKIPGRRIKKFVPPTWRSYKEKQEERMIRLQEEAMVRSGLEKISSGGKKIPDRRGHVLRSQQNRDAEV